MFYENHHTILPRLLTFNDLLVEKHESTSRIYCQLSFGHKTLQILETESVYHLHNPFKARLCPETLFFQQKSGPLLKKTKTLFFIFPKKLEISQQFYQIQVPGTKNHLFSYFFLTVIFLKQRLDEKKSSVKKMKKKKHFFYILVITRKKYAKTFF